MIAPWPQREMFDDVLEWSDLFSVINPTPLDSLAASLFVNSPNPRARLMAMFSAYFDASGNAKDQPFIVVAGYLANFMQWRLFESTWKNIHKEYGVKLPFHMADFMSAHTNPNYENQKNARPEYVAIAKDLKRSTEFFNHLCNTQQLMVNCGFSCIVNMSVYEGVSSLLDLRTIVPPYALGARSCVAMVHEWENRFGVLEPVECFFEEGDFEQDKFTDLVKLEGGPSPIYKKKQDYAGLQGADHYAWEQFHHLKKELLDTQSPHRGAFSLLLNAIPKMHLEVTTEGLINLCHAKRIDPRTGVRHDK